MMFNKILKEDDSPEDCLNKIDAMDKTKENQDNQDQLVQQVAISSSSSCCPNYSADDSTHYGNTITFVAYARVPACYTIRSSYVPEFMYNSCCLKCFVVPCTISDICIQNPCDDTKKIEGCSIKLNKIILLGSLKYYIDVFWATGTPGGGIASPGNEGVYCVNQILDYTCACNDVCPETIKIAYRLRRNPQGPIPQPNGDTLVPVDVTLTFTL